MLSEGVQAALDGAHLVDLGQGDLLLAMERANAPLERAVVERLRGRPDIAARWLAEAPDSPTAEAEGVRVGIAQRMSCDGALRETPELVRALGPPPIPAEGGPLEIRLAWRTAELATARDLALRVARDGPGASVAPEQVLPPMSLVAEAIDDEPTCGLLLYLEHVEVALVAQRNERTTAMLRTFEDDPSAELLGPRIALAEARSLVATTWGALPATFGRDLDLDSLGGVTSRARPDCPEEIGTAIRTAFDRACEQGERLGFGRLAAQVRIERAAFAIVEGRFDDAFDDALAARELARLRGDVLREARAGFVAAVAAAQRSVPLLELIDAMRVVAHLLWEAGTLGEVSSLATAGLAQADARLAAGDPDGAARLVTAIEELSWPLQAPRLAAAGHRCRASVFSLLGAGSATLVEVQRAQERSAEARRAGDLDELQAALAQLSPLLFTLAVFPSLETRSIREVARSADAVLARVPAPDPDEVARFTAAATAAVEASRRILTDPTPEAVSDLVKADDIARALEATGRQAEIRALATWLRETAHLTAHQTEGRAALDAGDPSAAAGAFERALDGLRGPDAAWHQAVIYRTWGRVEDARAALDRYVEAGLPTVDAFPAAYRSLLPDLGILGRHRTVAFQYADLDAFEEAAEHYARAGLTAEHPLPDEQLLERHVLDVVQLARATEFRGDIERARALFELALSCLDRLRQATRNLRLRRPLATGSTATRAYGEVIAFHLRHSEPAAAFRAAERGRALELVEGLCALRQVDPDEADAWRGHREALGALERAQQAWAASADGDLAPVRAAERRVSDAEKALLDASTRAGRLWLPERRQLDHEAIAARLGPGELLVSYHAYDDGLFCGVVGRDGLAFAAPIGPAGFHRRHLGHAVAALDEAMRRGAPIDEAAGRVAELLLEPIEDLLRPAAFVRFVPHLGIGRVPFAALPFDGGFLATGERSVSVLPAASLLEGLDAPAGEGAIVVGDPVDMQALDLPSGESRWLPPLPGSFLEAAAVAARYDVTPLLGEAVTEPAVREALGRSTRIAHFATHATVSGLAPMESAVHLSAGQRLTLDELSATRTATTVILSACDSAVSSREAELTSLGHALLGAGAREVLATLSPVADVVATLAMDELHRDPGPLPEAIGRTQRYLRSLDGAAALAALHRISSSLPASPLRDASAASCEAELLAAVGRWGDAEQRAREAAGIYESAELRAHSGALAQRARRYAIGRMVKRPGTDGPLFAHPRHWATFVVLGG